MHNSLEKFGFASKETKVYLATLELGATSVQKIARKAGVNRVTTYVILNSLSKKGLISTFEKGKKRFFAAENPEQLKQILRKQDDEIQKRKEDLAKVLPELKAIYNLSDAKTKIRFYEGTEGFKALQQDALRLTPTKGEIYSITPLDRYLESFPKQESVRDRIKKKIHAYIIYTHSHGPVPDSLNRKENRETRIVPQKKFNFESSIEITPDQVVRIYNFKPTFSGVVIHDKQIANTMKAFFDLAWEKADEYNKKIKNSKKQKNI